MPRFRVRARACIQTPIITPSACIRSPESATHTPPDFLFFFIIIAIVGCATESTGVQRVYIYKTKGQQQSSLHAHLKHMHGKTKKKKTRERTHAWTGCWRARTKSWPSRRCSQASIKPVSPARARGPIMQANKNDGWQGEFAGGKILTRERAVVFRGPRRRHRVYATLRECRTFGSSSKIAARLKRERRWTLVRSYNRKSSGRLVSGAGLYQTAAATLTVVPVGCSFRVP